MVTTRCSGDSCYNRVELQNGHLSKGHANLFIPATLKGEAVDADGKIEKLFTIQGYKGSNIL